MDNLLAGFQTQPTSNFLGLTVDEAALADATVVILPVPYEQTTSWGRGTAEGPRAILEASRYVELYDPELDAEPYELGVHTLPALHLPKGGPDVALAELRRAYDRLLRTGKFPIVLGGEHALSGPLIEAVADRLDASRLSVLQLDAHADLRPEYEGTSFSHASVMYRVHERVEVVPVGIRAMSIEERALIERRGIPAVYGHELDRGGAWIDRVLSALGPDVYLTVDVDYFDPALVPSTGTPEPGGGSWYPTLDLLERVFTERRVHGADVVELAPIAGYRASELLVAKLVYKLIGCLQKSRRT